MRITKINPWSWQDDFGFTQAWRLDGVGSLVLLSGQTGVDADGAVVHADDFEAECRLLFDNIAEVMRRAGGNLDDIFMITVYLTDIGDLAAFTEVEKEYFVLRLPARTAVGVTGLAVPGLRVEVEATAVLPAGASEPDPERRS
jgi:enamine deaminase RidA (YjgF/YER057c/UK114 family)